MSTESNRFAALLKRVADGDQQAAKELFDRYQDAVILFVRSRLRRYPELRRRFDSMDFLQEVWLNIFSQPEHLREFGTFKDFLDHLTRVAGHRVEHARRQHLETQKRDLRRVRPLSDPSVSDAAASVADPRSDPVAQAASHEAWSRWFFSLPKYQRRLVRLLRAGWTYPEIAERMRCSVRSVARMVLDIPAFQPS